MNVEFPEYASLNGIALKYTGRHQYYRNAGKWGVFVDENLVVTDKSQKELHHYIGCKLIPIDKQTWRDDNSGHINQK
jgi:hypothetical protein